jgi:predicted nucleotidyltransferase component of viral defense system
LSQSSAKKTFILKGAMLFIVWTKQDVRPTKDLDMLGFGHPTQDELQKVISEIIEIDIVKDGLIFEKQTIKIENIREEEEYHGLRVQLLSKLGNARIPIQVDVGYGDSVIPQPTFIEYPVLLDFPAPIIRAYAKETVIAEKFEAMIKRGLFNSRMKDYYDIWYLCQNFDFKYSVLKDTIKRTFERRKTTIPDNIPIGISDEFSQNRDVQVRWKAFVTRMRVIHPPSELTDIIPLLRKFIYPVIQENINLTSWKYKELSWR